MFGSIVPCSTVMDPDDPATPLIVPIEGGEVGEGSRLPIWRTWRFPPITVEPGVLLVFLGGALYGAAGATLMIDKVCRVNFNYSSLICDNLENHTVQQENVQKTAAQISMYSNVLNALPNIVIALFLGPYSDSHGRKPMIVLPCIGQIIAMFILMLNVFFASLRAEWLLLTSLASLCGGSFVLSAGIFAYIADITSEQERSMRIAFVDFFIFLSWPAGMYLTSPIQNALGYYGVFGITCGLTSLALLDFGLRIRAPISGSPRIRDVFQMRHLTEAFEAVVKPREYHRRRIIMILISMILLGIAEASMGNLQYFYTRLKFHWTEKDFTQFSATSATIVNLATFLFIALFSKKLRFSDTFIGLVGGISTLAGQLVYPLASKGWIMYLLPVMGLLSSVPPIIIRSMLSKLGDPDEIGKMFSLVACLQACIPLCIIPLLSWIYEQTVSSFPNAFLLVNPVMGALVILGFVYIRILLAREWIVPNEERLSAGDS